METSSRTTSRLKNTSKDASCLNFSEQSRLLANSSRVVCISNGIRSDYKSAVYALSAVFVKSGSAAVPANRAEAVVSALHACLQKVRKLQHMLHYNTVLQQCLQELPVQAGTAAACVVIASQHCASCRNCLLLSRLVMGSQSARKAGSTCGLRDAALHSWLQPQPAPTELGDNAASPRCVAAPALTADTASSSDPTAFELLHSPQTRLVVLHV